MKKPSFHYKKRVYVGPDSSIVEPTEGRIQAIISVKGTFAVNFPSKVVLIPRYRLLFNGYSIN